MLSLHFRISLNLPTACRKALVIELSSALIQRSLLYLTSSKVMSGHREAESVRGTEAGSK